MVYFNRNVSNKCRIGIHIVVQVRGYKNFNCSAMEATKYDCIGFAHLVSELPLISFEVALFIGSGYVVGGIDICNLITVSKKGIPVVLPITPVLLTSGLHTGFES